MEYLVLVLLAVVIFLLFRLIFTRKTKAKTPQYNFRGFDHNKIHKNGTKYDDHGFDYYGYDAEGFNYEGYNRLGKNRRGQYDRLFDRTSSELEGFYSPYNYNIALSTHAKERLYERLGLTNPTAMKKQVTDAYRFGKSKHQIKKSSAYIVDEIEQKHPNGIVLIYKNYIYVFSKENVLITVYKNDRISL